MRSPEYGRFMITIIWLFKMIVTIIEVDMEKLVPLVEMSKGKCIVEIKSGPYRDEVSKQFFTRNSHGHFTLAPLNATNDGSNNDFKTEGEYLLAAVGYVNWIELRSKLTVKTTKA